MSNRESSKLLICLGTCLNMSFQITVRYLSVYIYYAIKAYIKKVVPINSMMKKQESLLSPQGRDPQVQLGAQMS